MSCKKEDNWCQKEKRGCEGCYYESNKTLLNYIQELEDEVEHQKEKRENQRKQLAILNEKQVDFNKLVNTVKSYREQFKRQLEKNCELRKEIKELKNEIEEKTVILMAGAERVKFLETEIQELRSDLKDVLEQTLGAFEHNWCIDWNFTEIREKYGLEESEG